jgi:hypothetical protein
VTRRHESSAQRAARRKRTRYRRRRAGQAGRTDEIWLAAMLAIIAAGDRERAA